ncbi:hypothetical protein P171DRAFT_478310 [Karstenula rhodostoma CBS 690.94]|uniref:Myb-like domain-containing protein n=1 Tax=Karstenula rhodostoma CBS 690.94 TaxID=1392251 RepID=A0A9P4PW13_9PLEO|nr:hypothetical protein P171DRAFT_478310 [Karstenula rhodostoma CBS 690.94]
MADNPPPRIRTSYLLGFSNKPFKDPPKPPPLDSYRGMLRTPGAAIEWAASDGRRGRLTGKGRPRLLGALDAAAAVQGQLSVVANADPGASNNPTQSGSGGNEASKQSSDQAADSGEVEYKKGVPSKDNFTEEEDRTLMRMKIDGASWGDIVAKMNGKDKKKCTDRFKEIMPDDFWQKKNAGKDNSKGGKGGKQGKQKNPGQDTKEQEKKEDKTAEAPGEGGWEAMADLGGVFGDDNKSNASGKGSMKDDKGGTGDAAAGGWGGTGDWAAAGGNDNNAEGNTGWADTGNDKSGEAGWENNGNDNTAGGGNPWGNSDWTTQAGGEKDSNRKDEGKKSKKEKKQEKNGNENEKSNKKESEPNAATNPWDTGNGGSNSGGGAVKTGWDTGGWQAQDGEDKKSESKKSKASSSSSLKKISNNSWNADGDSAGATGGWPAPDGGGGDGPGWGDNKTDTVGAQECSAGWGDSKADTSGTQDFGAGWGATAPSEKGKSSKDDDPKKKDKSSDSAAWNVNWDPTPASPRKPTSRASSRDREKHRSSRRRSDSRDRKHRSHRHHSSSHPAEYKVAPDSTFSQGELKLIARILQQDCSMVWERVSWRFKDKTGRNVPPEVFEKKITGKLEQERRH